MENQVLQNMRLRRSCRGFQPRQITDEELNAVLEAGLWAASGMNRQSQILVAVQDKETLAQLSHLNAAFMGKPGTDPFYGAPTAVVVLVKADVPTAVEDGSLALGNMMNAAASLGLGSCWIHRARETFSCEEGKALLAKWGLEGDYLGVGHCALGYPVQKPGEGTPRREGRVIRVP